MSADPLRRMSIKAHIILRVPGSPDLQVGNETIHFHPEPTFDKEKYKRILIERSLLNPDDDIIVNFGMLSSSDRSVILTRVSDSAGGLANNGSGFNGLPYMAKPPKTYPTPIFNAMMAEIKATYPDYPLPERIDSRPASILYKYQAILNNYCPNYETKYSYIRNKYYYNFDNEISYIGQFERLCQKEKEKEVKQKNLLTFPTLQNNLSGLFSGPAGAGGGGAGSAVRHRKRKQRKTQKRKNRRNRTRKN
jgi:hypothetical protein